MKTPSSKVVILVVLVILLASLACSIDMGNSSDSDNISIQQTLVALQITQTALENQVPDAPVQPVIEPTETLVTPDVIYGNISFSYDHSIARSIFPATIPGQNMGEDYMPGDTYPTHTEFTFDTYAVSDHFHTPKILVYPVDEYRAISEFASESIDNLQQVLLTQSRGGLNAGLPFLPFWPAAQIFSSQVSYFDFQNGSGIRYLTMYGQAIYPVDNQNLFYTYQGITHDGRYYISAVLPITNMGLPDDGSSQIVDWMAFEEAWEGYIADTVEWLDDQDPRNFTPSLLLLDAMMSSIQIEQ